MTTPIFASLPSPSSPVLLDVGPFTLRYYGLFIVVAIVVGAWLTGRELVRKGYDGMLALEALFVVVPLGVVGARLYHVLPVYGDRYSAHPSAAVEIWNGGLGIYGAVAGGFLGVLLFCLYRGVGPLAFADAAAPGLVLAQAIGRWGNYFNQELFGRPTDLPWGLEISPQNRPVEFADATAFHPTFLYEAVWDAILCLVLLYVARRLSERLRDGDVFLLYVCLYSAGRFLVETLRVDDAFVVWGSVRGDLVVSGVLALGFAAALFLRHARSPLRRGPTTG